jgi:biopolymer transport protein ExbD
MARSSMARGEVITGINVTPLVDVVLVLLVVLMVTAGYIASRAIPVVLPRAATGEGSAPTLAISIKETGELFVDAVPVTREGLRERVRNLRRVSSETRAVIAADGRVQHRQVVEVIDALRLENVTRFAINVAPESVSSGSP